MYPHFITDTLAAETYCAAELCWWRALRAVVRGEKKLTRRMKIRPRYEAAFDSLKAAYTAAVRQTVAA